MLALIDADVLLYQMGAITNDEGHPLAWNLVRLRVDERIKFITSSAGCTDFKLFLTGKHNFRIAEATILPYKGNRPEGKPHWHGRIKELFLESPKYKDKTTISEYWEADDEMSMALLDDLYEVKECYCPDLTWDEQYEQQSNVVLCTIDKDLDMCPGKHGRWYKTPKGKLVFKNYTISQEQGTWWFYRQLMTGDMTDNIRGLYNVGHTSAQAALRGVTDEQELYDIVQKWYEKRFSNYWDLFLHETARMIWMLESPDDDIRVRLRELEERRVLAVIKQNESEF